MANYTILLIDYEPRSIERFRDPLVGAGYTVEIATDGLTGIEAFHRLNPDMVLVEAMIPKKHGFEVCQELKRSPHGRKTPVLITTGVYKGRKYRTQALHIYGCDEYIEKPIAPEQLLAVVGKFFGGASRVAPAEAAMTESRPAEKADAAAVASSDGAARAHAPVATVEAPAAARTTPRKSTPVPTSAGKDFTEEEIMARLDAILPGLDLPQTPRTHAEPIATAPTPEPIRPAPIEVAPPISQQVQDPFSQMQEELTAELGSMAAALALEPAPVFEPLPEPMPSDQAVSPSVLEALPLPELEPTPTPPTPQEMPVVSETKREPASAAPPGQIVSFDAKRSRKKKNGNRTEQQRPPAPPAAEAAPPARAAEAPIATSSRAPSVPTPSESLTLPAGTLAESELAGPVKKSGVPAWTWAALVVVGLVAAYFAVGRGGLTRSVASPTRPVTVESASAEPAVPPPAEAPPAEAANSNSKLVLNSVGAPARRPSTTTAPASGSPAPRTVELAPAPAAKSAISKAVLPASPTPGRSSTELPPSFTSTVPSATVATVVPAKDPPAAEPPAPGKSESPPTITAPTSAEQGNSGVEALVNTPTPPAAPTIAPGTLVSIDDVDTAPVTLSRTVPTYSAQARQMRLQGTVVMKVLINERGVVDEVELVNGVYGADLNESAMRSAKSWTYRPATKAGVPVKVWKVEQVAFRL